ncbi:hypothetical protein BleG1_2850 [Shouchella lehensis G1]|uniref:Uncharacterized protein n=1 Tax=Shouchella lehensis G1 TaxID=1246626 RepID=A0A060M5Q2_9BACI|nr:hypothetical protein BleG1_2850 [Shouchella lehensis G1]
MRLYVRNFLKGGDAVSEKEIGYYANGFLLGALIASFVWYFPVFIF